MGEILLYYGLHYGKPIGFVNSVASFNPMADSRGNHRICGTRESEDFQQEFLGSRSSQFIDIP